MNKNKLLKQLWKYYWSHGQNIIVDTWEMMTNDDGDCLFDVHLAGTDIFLFTIQNYNGFKDLRVVNTSYFKNPKSKVIETWDGVKASYTPLYLDQTFTLKTFKLITKEDIIHATDYFMHEVLGIWSMFNIRFTKEEKKQ